MLQAFGVRKMYSKFMKTVWLLNDIW